MVVETPAMSAVAICVMLKLSDDGLRIFDISGADANIVKNDEKKPNHEVWKARPCGLVKLFSTSLVALCSSSTGTANFWPYASLVPR